MKTRLGIVRVTALAFGLGACGASPPLPAVMAPPAEFGQGQAEAAAAPAAPPPATAAPSFAQPTGAPPPAPPMSPRSTASAEEAERAPSERPGLGTEWGETRFSQVHEEAFDRASADPFAIASVRYDDRAGVDAMVRRHTSFVRTASALPIELTRSGSSFARDSISLYVKGEDGSPLEVLRAGNRVYVVGQAGERYSIVLSNRTGRRFEAVATVDGLDVMNGEPGSLANRGYLLGPYATLEIDGFRRSDATVAAFRFGKVGDSYAAQTGSARDVGVLGVAFFAERGYDRAEEARFRDSATPFPGDSRYAQPPR